MKGQALIRSQNEKMECVVRRLENMLLVESVEKEVLDQEASLILQEMCDLVETTPEIVQQFNDEMQKTILDIVDLSCLRAEGIKQVRLIHDLDKQMTIKAHNIVKRFDLLEQFLNGGFNQCL